MSEVTALDFRNSLFAAFETFWAGRTELATPNNDWDPANLSSNDDAWVRLYILGDPTGQTRYSNSVARDHFQRSGTFTVEIYVRQNKDVDLAYQLAEAVQEFLAKPGVADSSFSDVSAPVENGPDGTWFQVVVSASWLYWTDRAA